MIGLAKNNPIKRQTWPVPTAASGAIGGGLITATINITARSSLLPLTGVTGFALTINGISITITSITISGKVVTLNFALVIAGLPALVSYSGGNVTDSRGQPLTAFSNLSISNP